MQNFILLLTLATIATMLWVMNDQRLFDQAWRQMSPEDRHYYGQSDEQRRVDEAIRRALSPNERLN